MRRERRIEPWPVALALALAAMIVVAVGFWRIAATHPDPVLHRGPQPGIEAP